MLTDRNQKIVCVVEARMTSSRLPGKTMKKIMGKPMLQLLIERLKRAKTIIAFSLFIKFKDGAYYGSAADDPDVQVDVPIAHIIQWKAIEWLKEKKIKYYEIGWQQFGNQFYDFPSYKELSICFFKRGFGGLSVPLFRGEKFYDVKFMEQTLKKRVDMLVSGPLI